MLIVLLLCVVVPVTKENGSGIIAFQWNHDTICTISFYKTVNRGDRRLSISGIKKKAQINDLIAFNYKRVILDNDLQENVIVINVTAKAENRKIA